MDPSRGEPDAHSLDNLAGGWHQTQSGKNPAIDDGLAIDEDLVLSVSAVDRLDVDLQFSPQLRRHTDGVETGQSIRTIANDNSCHLSLHIRYACRGDRLSPNRHSTADVQKNSTAVLRPSVALSILMRPTAKRVATRSLVNNTGSEREGYGPPQAAAHAVRGRQRSMALWSVEGSTSHQGSIPTRAG